VEAEEHLDSNVSLAFHGVDFGIEVASPTEELKVGSFQGYTF